MFYIDPEKLISAIKARPSLYDRHDKMYYANKNQNHFKEMMWLEVAQEVCGNTVLRDEANFVSEVQKRWRSLRSCFARELAIQKREQNRNSDGSGFIKRRKKYEYFDSLLFLKGEADTNEIKSSNEENEVSKVSLNCVNEHVFFYNENDEEMMKEIKLEAPDDYEVKETERVMFERSDNVEEMKREDHDEDQQFALSLVPSLRKLDSKRKLDAKIDILKAIKAVTYRNE